MGDETVSVQEYMKNVSSCIVHLYEGLEMTCSNEPHVTSPDSYYVSFNYRGEMLIDDVSIVLPNEGNDLSSGDFAKVITAVCDYLHENNFKKKMDKMDEKADKQVLVDKLEKELKAVDKKAEALRERLNKAMV